MTSCRFESAPSDDSVVVWRPAGETENQATVQRFAERVGDELGDRILLMTNFGHGQSRTPESFWREVCGFFAVRIHAQPATTL